MAHDQYSNYNSNNNNNINIIKSNKGSEIIKCFQINAQHSKAATHNLMTLVAEKNVDIVLIQEPYCFNNKLAAVSNGIDIFTYGSGKKRAAILTNNKSIDCLIVAQYSNEDYVPTSRNNKAGYEVVFYLCLFSYKVEYRRKPKKN